MSRLAERLRQLRGGKSLYEMESETGIARSALSKYERGQRMPTPETLKKLAGYFEAPYEELRMLSLDDFAEDPNEQAILLNWALQKRGFPDNIRKLLEAYESAPKEVQKVLLQEITALLSKHSKT